MLAAEASSAPVQVLAVSKGMGLLALCLFSAQRQPAVPSPTYHDARFVSSQAMCCFPALADATLLDSKTEFEVE